MQNDGTATTGTRGGGKHEADSWTQLLELSQKVIDTVRESMLVLDTELRVIAANQSFYETFRTSPAETEGKLVYDLGNRQWDLPALRELLDNVLPQNSVFNDFEVVHEFESIGRKVMLLNGRRVDHIQRILLAIEDITERRKSELAIRESEERLRIAAEATGFGTFDYDVSSKQSVWSDQLYALSGLPLEITPDNETMRRLVHPDDRERFERGKQQALDPAGPGRHDLEFRIVLPNGKTRWVRDTGRTYFSGQGEQRQAVRVVGTIRDITEEVRSRDLLRTSENKFRTLFEAIDQGFCIIEMIWDAQGTPIDFRFLEVNSSFERQTGLPDVVGKTVREFAPHHEAHWFELYGRIARTGEPARFERWSGQLHRWYEAYAWRHGDPADQRVAVLFNDVTERKFAEEQRSKRNATLEQQVSERTEILRLLQDVTRSANEARTVEDLLRTALRRIAQFNDWQVGHVWQAADDDSGQLVSSDLWYVRGQNGRLLQKFERFKQACAGLRIASGDCLVGNVMETRVPEWIDDIAQLDGWSRDRGAEFGLRAAVAFPILIEGNELVAVMEFFSARPICREANFMAILPDIGIQIGHVIQRKRLEKLVADASDFEQRRIGGDIHDGVGQELTGLRYVAQTHLEVLTNQSSPEVNTARLITEWLGKMQQQLRDIVRKLVPVEIDELGLVDALAELARQTTQRQGLVCSFICRQPVRIQDTTRATHLYRVAQEAVRNAVRHAEASHIQIKLDEADGVLTLQIEDDGRGFDRQTVRKPGFGLRSMAYRADLIGAHFDCQQRAAGGTRIVCAWKQRPPIQESSAGADR